MSEIKTVWNAMKLITNAIIGTFFSYDMKSEVQAFELRPHPWEFALYYDI